MWLVHKSLSVKVRYVTMTLQSSFSADAFRGLHQKVVLQ
jgi:hypothetical protein